MSALRIARPGQPVILVPDRDPYAGLTAHQRRVLDVLRGHGGNRSRAARDLGTTVQSVQATLRVVASRGGPVLPGSRRGPDLAPRSRS